MGVVSMREGEGVFMTGSLHECRGLTGLVEGRLGR